MNNMREIKFRAWDEDNKVMLNEIERSDIHIDSSGYLIKHCRLIIMQYTGLKDKNGKEIYEGDIVKDQWTHYPDKVRLHEVKFGQHETSDDYYNDTAYGFYYDTPQTALTEYEARNCEVVGNIYQNPELIK